MLLDKDGMPLPRPDRVEDRYDEGVAYLCGVC